MSDNLTIVAKDGHGPVITNTKTDTTTTTHADQNNGNTTHADQANGNTKTVTAGADSVVDGGSITKPATSTTTTTTAPVTTTSGTCTTGTC
jgi:hypothetical protein